ncbi:MAG: hypothetical protein ACTS47_00530 [Candidatus Hodgkinia cicadicola]
MRLSWVWRIVRRDAESKGNERWSARSSRWKLQLGRKIDKAERVRFAVQTLLKWRMRCPPEACCGLQRFRSATPPTGKVENKRNGSEAIERESAVALNELMRKAASVSNWDKIWLNDWCENEWKRPLKLFIVKLTKGKSVKRSTAAILPADLHWIKLRWMFQVWCLH